MKMLLVTARELTTAKSLLPEVNQRGEVRCYLSRPNIMASGEQSATHILSWAANCQSCSKPFWELQTPVFVLSESDMSKHLKAGDHYFEPEGGRFWP